ncbi:MAG: protein translocase subunit SecD [Campylobacterales bacterium]|nr:protein translocase subunit SecD [Campylobacterales bacterium]
MKKLNYRIVLFALALIFASGVLLSGKRPTLGLDLQGGLHMLLEVKSDVAIQSRIKSIATNVAFLLDSEEIFYDSLAINDESVTFEILDGDDLLQTKALIQKNLSDAVEIKENGLDFELVMTEQEKENTKTNAINQAVDTIRNRLDQFGLAEPTVAKQGEDKILVEVPGIKTQEDEQRIRDLIAKAAHLQLMAVDELRNTRVTTMTSEEASSFGDVILYDVRTKEPYLLREIPILDGSMLTNANVVYDENNRPAINFELNGQGAKIFGDFTGKNISKRMAIVLDDKVYSAPYIRTRIGGGRGQITGSFGNEEAHDVAIALRSGALLAPVDVMEKRSVGPSLGADSIRASLFALVFGFIVVVIFMVIYYAFAGVIANIALIVNLLLIISVMALFGATLTLPGMAGIVLTVGMAVDANVIISERIRELLREGKSVAKAIEDGYSNAFSAIWDANITTLIAAVVLYVYGTGPVKGFALTMSIGILASMLTAILGTHGIYEYLLDKINKNRLKFWFGIKE